MQFPTTAYTSRYTFVQFGLPYDFIKEFNRAEDEYMIYRLNYTIIIYTIIIRINAAAFITILVLQERRLFENGVYTREAFIAKKHNIQSKKEKTNNKIRMSPN